MARGASVCDGGGLTYASGNNLSEVVVGGHGRVRREGFRRAEGRRRGDNRLHKSKQCDWPRMSVNPFSEAFFLFELTPASPPLVFSQRGVQEINAQTTAACDAELHFLL